MPEVFLEFLGRAGSLEVELGVAERGRKRRGHVVSEATQEWKENGAGSGEIGGIHILSVSPEADITCLAPNIQVSLPGLKKDSAGKRI